MIRNSEGRFIPGSAVPLVREIDSTENVLVEEYLLSAAWESGEGLLLLGFAGCGKTTLGVAELKEIAKVSPL